YKCRWIPNVLGRLGRAEGRGYRGVTKQEAGNVGPAARGGCILSRESVVKIEGYGPTGAIIVDAVVANAAPIYSSLQTVAPGELGHAANKTPGVRNEEAIIAAAAARSSHLVVPIVVL